MLDTTATPNVLIDIRAELRAATKTMDKRAALDRAVARLDREVPRLTALLYAHVPGSGHAATKWSPEFFAWASNEACASVTRLQRRAWALLRELPEVAEKIESEPWSDALATQYLRQALVRGAEQWSIPRRRAFMLRTVLQSWSDMETFRQSLRLDAQPELLKEIGGNQAWADAVSAEWEAVKNGGMAAEVDVNSEIERLGEALEEELSAMLGRHRDQLALVVAN